MTAVRALGRSALFVAMIVALLLPPGVSPAGTTQDRLRKEKARLTEMRKEAEKAAAELDRALKRERAARHKVDDIRKRLKSQRSLIARIDRKLNALARKMEKAESEVRSIEEARASRQRGLERSAVLAFDKKRDAAGLVLSLIHI